jgi:hypothetical protein
VNLFPSFHHHILAQLERLDLASQGLDPPHELGDLSAIPRGEPLLQELDLALEISHALLQIWLLSLCRLGEQNGERDEPASFLETREHG